MRFNGRTYLAFLAVIVLVGMALPIATLQAQNSSGITITLAVSAFEKGAFSDKLIGDFEAANPAIKVQLVDQQGRIPDATQGLDAHLAAVQTYVSSADVLAVSSNTISVEATRAGYFLNLEPLVSEDKTINTEDFYPAIWQSFQWDKGIWALPTAANVYVLTYKPAAFQAAGLPEPTEKWTLDDLVNATEKLAQKDSTGAVTQHGMDIQGGGGLSTLMLFRSLLGNGLYDDSTVPSTPKLDQPAVTALVDAWSKLVADGVVGNGNSAPMSISVPTGILVQNALAKSDADKKVAVLLPGGQAGLDVSGFAVSKGTEYPDQAYALAAFLTTRVETANRGADSPARKSMVSNNSNGGGGFQLNLTPDMQKLLDQSIANGIPVSELRFANYLNVALADIKANATPVETAIQNAEAGAQSNLQAAASKAPTVALVVATPVPADVNTSGKPTLNFGLVSFARGNAQKEWTTVAANFASTDPQVGEVKVDVPTGFANTAEALADKYDCFYLPSNSVQDMQLSSFLNLDPYMAADKSFDKNDIVASLMTQVTRDNKVWALPIELEPTILKYDATRFDKQGVPEPTNGWTVSEFNDAIKALKPAPTDNPPFVSSTGGGAHLYLLMAAFGGLPLDFRTDPPTINYTDPKTIDAIQQVLDLAKNGYIQYSALGTLTGGGGGRIPNADIITQSLNAFFRPQGGGGGPRGGNGGPNGTPSANAAPPDTYKSVTFPKGTTFNAVSYNLGTAYISAKTQLADACYRWISTISKNTTLFAGMPARRSLINDPATTTSQGADTVALYNQVDQLLQDSTTIAFPGFAQGGGGNRMSAQYFYQLWLGQAFDSYVLSNGDLDSGLKDAQTKSQGLSDCVAALPPYDPTSQDSRAQYQKAYGQCVVKMDPNSDFAKLFALTSSN
jgi:ABC-type glycerol-3-phosphate transport system substrate-binding protein